MVYKNVEWYEVIMFGNSLFLCNHHDLNTEGHKFDNGGYHRLYLVKYLKEYKGKEGYYNTREDNGQFHNKD